MYGRHFLRMKWYDRIRVHFLNLSLDQFQPHIYRRSCIVFILDLQLLTNIINCRQSTECFDRISLTYRLFFWMQDSIAFPQFLGMFLVSFLNEELCEIMFFGLGNDRRPGTCNECFSYCYWAFGDDSDMFSSPDRLYYFFRCEQRR